MVWTEEETNVLKNAYEIGHELEDIVDYMKGSGHDKSLASIRAKISSLKRSGWEPNLDAKKTDDPIMIDWVLVGAITIGAIIIGWWWSSQ